MGDTKTLGKGIIISRMRHLSHKRYVKFKDELDNLFQESIYQFNRFYYLLVIILKYQNLYY